MIDRIRSNGTRVIGLIKKEEIKTYFPPRAMNQRNSNDFPQIFAKRNSQLIVSLFVQPCLTTIIFFHHLCAGEVSVRLWDSVGIYSSICNHYHLLCPHPEAPEADPVPPKGSQRETHPGYCGDVWLVLAAVPCHQHDSGEWQGFISHQHGSGVFFLNKQQVYFHPFKVAAEWYKEDSPTRLKWVT